MRPLSDLQFELRFIVPGCAFKNSKPFLVLSVDFIIVGLAVLWLLSAIFGNIFM
jgi:hypothetical protein